MAKPTSPNPSPRPAFNAPELHEKIMRLRAVDNVTNLGFLAFEYLCIIGLFAGTVLFCESRTGWGLAWAWNVPVVATTMVLMGALQHRLAGLGHEASHYTFLRNKFWNDLIADLFCMFPIMSTVHFYRVFHLAHHQYTNDPHRDPDLVSLGGSKMVDRFPMGRREFIRSIYLRVVTEPLEFLHYQRDYFDINVLGRSNNEYMKRSADADSTGRAWPRTGSTLGIIYLISLAVIQSRIFAADRTDRIVGSGILGTLIVLVVGALLPSRGFFPSPFRQPYSCRVSGMMRLTVYTWAIVALSLLRAATGGWSVVYVWLLWIAPLMSTFTFFMLLRDVYQHTNADDGRLTNTRVFFADPFTRWAVFVYGQDVHTTHHLFPAIPHYYLPSLHQLLKSGHSEYAAHVVECHGTFANATGQPTILGELARSNQPTPAPWGLNRKESQVDAGGSESTVRRS